MRPYAIVDLHCDTLTSAPAGVDTLERAGNALTLTKLPDEVHWAQFFAVFLPDEVRGAAAIDFFARYRASFERQMLRFADRVLPCRNAGDLERAWAENKTAAFLTVENGSVLAGDIRRVRTLAAQGVCAITLTWNGENELGAGHAGRRGLTPFGRSAVREMENEGILVDVSHLNDRGFHELLEVAERPFLATHSNARAVCAHPRNLTDGMLREMVRRGCLVGVNYYVSFLRDDANVRSLDDVYRHISHILDLGGARILALGSDFDGAEVPDCLSSPARVAALYEYLLSRGLSQHDVDGIFYRNAQDFLRRNLR